MENAVDALKISFAMFVFALALALMFNVVAQARATGDIVFQLNDKTEEYEYVTSSSGDYNAQKDRIVGWETILPTIYRYHKEQYGVTIVDTSGKPIVRFDLNAESQLGNWQDILKWKDITSSTNSQLYNQYQTTIEAYKTTYNDIKYILDEVDNVIDKEIPGRDSNYKLINQLDNLTDLYKVDNNANVSVKIGAPWIGNADEILKRIAVDAGGGVYSRNMINYTGKNLLGNYKNRKFKEKFVEIQTSGIIATDGNTNDSLEVTNVNRKLEIIYIMQ